MEQSFTKEDIVALAFHFTGMNDQKRRMQDLCGNLPPAFKDEVADMVLIFNTHALSIDKIMDKVVVPMTKEEADRLFAEALEKFKNTLKGEG